MYFVEVNGAQTTLVITPENESILIDGSSPDQGFHAAGVIAAIAKLAKIDKIDYWALTHEGERDSGSGLQSIAALPVGAVITAVRKPKQTVLRQASLRQQYNLEASGDRRVAVKAGDHLPIAGDVDAIVVSADGNLLPRPLPTGGNVNTFCAATSNRQADSSEHGRALGTFWHYGRFRMMNLGDLNWNKEEELVCPVNRLGKVDVLAVSPGFGQKSSAALVHDLTPRIAILGNDARNDSSPSTYDLLQTEGSLKTIWQLRRSEVDGRNTPDSYIANTGSEKKSYYLKLTAHDNGAFEVYNSRNKVNRKYEAPYSFGSYKWEIR
jgi:beta-lactamase superfamily II metal-dependent hydrolase